MLIRVHTGIVWINICKVVEHIESFFSCAGLSFDAKSLLPGCREGHVTLYRSGQYPAGCLGDVRFLWQPVLELSLCDPTVTNVHAYDSNPGQPDSKEQTCRHLWIWMHPGSYPSVLQEIVQAFQAKQTNSLVPGNDAKPSQGLGPDVAISSDKREAATAGSDTKEKQASKGSTTDQDNRTSKPMDTIPHGHASSEFPQVTFSNGHVQIVSLKDTLCRYRLTGPLSQAVLHAVLQTATISSPANNNASPPAKWWQVYAKSHSSVHDSQRQAWDDLGEVQSPAELPPRLVVGLTTRDPRLFLPRKRKMTSSSEPAKQDPEGMGTAKTAVLH